MEKEKKEKLAKIRQNDLILKEISQKKVNNLSKLHVVREQMNVQKKFIQTLKEQIADIDENLNKKQKILQELQAELKALKKEYASMIYALAKTHSAYKKMLYLFSSESFNQLYKRLLYLAQYQEARKRQVQGIQKLSQEIEAERKEQEKMRAEKQALLNEKLGITQSLKNLEESNSLLVKQLSAEELKLKAEIDKDKKALAQLDQAISQMVQRELVPIPSSDSQKDKETNIEIPSPTQLTPKKGNFVKGKLLFPVRKGFVAIPFGKYEHPVLQGVTIESNGIEIQTQPNEPVYAVADGKVTAIAKIPGMVGQVIMIQHGSFFSVYAKVHNIRVGIGQYVKGGQCLAYVVIDEQGDSKLQLQLWHQHEKLNPEVWLAPR
ncbi:MAG: peptidoglycan DD-metalloendopeptidase family protein [Microscillaceae bacterium]|nr:peptidoglycan DD-metalloendopeptidase family protein [Microscillaceae bacterium]MDW8460686.1 peptidoglycan DD-metalloendopeptidase family protein [Cytophagales bacterium]